MTQPMRQIRNCDPAKSRMNGRRTAHRCLGSEEMRSPPAQPPACGRMIKVTKAQYAPRGHHIAFVDTQTGGGGKDQSKDRGDEDQPKDCRKPHPISALFPFHRAGISITATFLHSNECRPDGRSQASTTRCVWIPRPSTPKRMTSPAFKNIGAGFTPAPTPGGVPVAMTSPACSVMKWLT